LPEINRMPIGLLVLEWRVDGPSTTTILILSSEPLTMVLATSAVFLHLAGKTLFFANSRWPRRVSDRLGANTFPDRLTAGFGALPPLTRWLSVDGIWPKTDADRPK